MMKIIRNPRHAMLSMTGKSEESAPGGKKFGAIRTVVVYAKLLRYERT